MDILFTALALAIAFTLIDWLLGIAKSFKLGTFDVRKLPDQLAEVVLPYITPLLGGAFVALQTGQPVQIVVTGIAFTVAGKLLLECVDKAGVLLGVPTPPRKVGTMSNAEANVPK